MTINNIGVIGAGKLGLSFALLCQKKGYNVIASDKNPAYIEKLNDRSYKTSEPYIEEYLKMSRNIKFTIDNRDVVNSCDLMFLFVPTPSLPTGEYDHQYIEEVIQELEAIGKAVLWGKILVIGCTVMPGYTQTIIDRIEEKLGITVVYNPEFIAQGSIIQGLETADMVLVGTKSKIVGDVILTAVYRQIMTTELNMRVMSPTAAEITKISINCFLTTKIAYANMIGEIAIESGVEDEVSTILTAIGDDSRIGNKFLRYGYGYGGVCLPRDNRALGIHMENVGMNNRLPATIDTLNIIHSYFLKGELKKKNSEKLPFLFDQLAYKKGVDILIESPAYNLCKQLLQEGYSVNIQETEVIKSIVKEELSEYEGQITYEAVTEGYKINL